MEKMSFWIFKESKNIDQYVSILNNDRLNYIQQGDSNKIVSLMNSPEIEKKSVNLFNKDIEYCFIRLRTEETSGKENFTDILMYSIDGSKVKMNVFRGNTNTTNIIRPYFNQPHWGELGDFKENKLEVTEDLLFWLFKMYIDTKTISLSKIDDIYINALKGYSGVTKDNNNRVRGEGERISEILGTLAFLLNNDPLKMLRPKIYLKYGSETHDILLELKMSGTIKIDSRNYKGSFLGVYSDEELVAILSLLCSEFIIPKLIQSHRDALIDDRWNISLKKDFLQRIGTEIQNRVQFELNKLNGEDTEENEDDEEDEDDEYDEELVEA
ncbi:MAG: hypothetical protein E7C86_03825 [Paeniclostridium sordellii]|nr:hypothetical protein [[Eubacterium] tenue]MDU2591728.1 hypothetical protein [Paeniclostridium sordellii]